MSSPKGPLKLPVPAKIIFEKSSARLASKIEAIGK